MPSPRHSAVAIDAFPESIATTLAHRPLVVEGDAAAVRPGRDAGRAAEGAEQIVVARKSDRGLVQRFFGSSTGNLVMHASVPVTVVG